MLGEPLRTTAEVKSGAATPTFSGILGRVPAQGNILPQTTATDVLADHYPEARGQAVGTRRILQVGAGAWRAHMGREHCQEECSVGWATGDGTWGPVRAPGKWEGQDGGDISHSAHTMAQGHF